ncbi:MAG TPA: Maf family protein [Gallionellaceae bacterium]
MSKQPYIYLASQSPRRRDLLKQIGVNFQLLLMRADPRRLPDVDETPLPDETAQDYVQRICKAKAEAGWDSLLHRNLPQMPVLSADTTVTLDNHILGKPRDRAEAAAMLRQLSGRSHQVLTAVAMVQDTHFQMRVSSSEVRFAALSEERIQRYVHSDEAHDKAGAYGIQGIAGAFVEHLSGSYSGVMGLPLFETTELLHSFGYPAP